MKWRKPREDLVALLDEVIPQGEAPVEFKPMFGGPCYWSGGNMFAAVHQESIIVRLGEQDRAALLAEPGAHLFEPMEGRPMREYVAFPDAMLADKDALRAWLGKGLANAASLPPKEKKPRKKRWGLGPLRRLARRGVGHRRLDRHRRDAGEVADDVHELAVGRHDDLGVLPERLLDRLQLAQHLGVADEVLLGRLVDQLDRLRLALGGEDLGLLDALRLLDLGAPLAVRLSLGRGREVDRRDLLVLGLDDLVHRLLHVHRRVDLLELRAQDLDAPAGGLDLERHAQGLVDLAALRVRRLERERADDVAQRGARQVDDLVLVVGDVVLRGLDTLFVVFDLEVDLRVDLGVEVVVGDDLLRLRLDQYLANVDPVETIDARPHSVQARATVGGVRAQTLYQAAVRRAHDTDAEQGQDDERDDDHADDGQHDGAGGRHGYHDSPGARAADATFMTPSFARSALSERLEREATPESAPAFSFSRGLAHSVPRQ